MAHVLRLLRNSISLSLLLVVIAFIHARTKAETFLIDFSESISGGGPGGTWNLFSAPSGINGSALKDSTGTTSAITFSYSGNLTNSGNAGTSLTYDNTSVVGNPSWAASPTSNGAAGDLFYTDNGSSGIVGEVVFTLSGLKIGDTVSIDFLGSRNTGAADGYYSFSLDGGTNFSGFTVLNPDGSLATGAWAGANTKDSPFDNLADGYTAHRYMNASNLTLTTTTLQIKVRDISTANGNFAAMNAMRVDVVPEPASALLLAGGSALLAGLTRRRQSALQP